MMKKYQKRLTVKECSHPASGYALLKLTDAEPLPEMRAGQFVQAKVEGSSATFLRRPVSINFVDREANELWLLVREVGSGTRRLSTLNAGDTLDVLFPLGNGFGSCRHEGEKVLLVGGGVGIAPLLYLGRELTAAGAEVCFLLGGRTAADLLELDLFARYGTVYTTTEDGSLGEKGFVTRHSILGKTAFERICCCGPKPMMMAVGRFARKADVACEVSLENMMACGLGACLCCVENTMRGHVCVCTEGPVFDIRQLTWE